jgi:hypothetical protein
MSGIIGTSHSKSKVVGRSQDTAKAWIFFNGSSVSGTGTGGIVNSYNVSSLTDHATGNVGINYTTPMATTDYAVVTTGYNYDYIVSGRGEATGTTVINTWSSVNEVLVDMEKCKVVIFGD